MSTFARLSPIAFAALAFWGLGAAAQEGLIGAKDLSCTMEEAIRKILADAMGHQDGPAIIRAVFHDAVDADNLIVKNLYTGMWEPQNGTYGGVDGCLYSPLSKGMEGKPEPSHNRNIPTKFKFASKWCERLCRESLALTSLCSSMANCIVDITVLASLVAVESAGGPRIGMTWGRQKGFCETMITKPSAQNLEVPGDYDTQPALRFAPSLTGIDDAQSFRTTFALLGFNPTDQAALMGAHSFGQLEVCAGGLNGIERGPFCHDPKLLNPPLNQSNYVSWSQPPGNCTPQVNEVGECWVKGTSKLRPVYATQNGGYKTGQGDGGFWDRTPEKFDNDYYKLFAANMYDEKEVCCGKIKRGGCHRWGNMVRITERDVVSGKAIKGDYINGQACAVQWCRSDRKGRSHMKSTKTWHEASHDFMKKASHHGTTKRMIRLAGDWALLENRQTRAAVELFAESEEAFFVAFKEAFSKLIAMGYTNLTSCSGSIGSAEQVEEAHQKMSCQDTHRKCATLRRRKCKEASWLMRCPRRCNACPKPEGQSTAKVGVPRHLQSMRSDDLTPLPSLYIQI